MKIQSVQTNQSFGAKEKFLNKSQLENARSILNKMIAGNTSTENEYAYSVRYLDSLELEDGRTLYKGLTGKVEGRTSLALGKTKIEFDNETGRIVSLKKSMFTKWSKIMKNVSDFLCRVKDDFDNETIVKKHYTRATAFTPKGSKKLDEAIKARQAELKQEH